MNNHHNHGHGPDCACGCHGHGHEPSDSIVDSALRFSRKSDIVLDTTISSGELERGVAELLMETARRLSIDGTVLGHIKALIQADVGGVSLSITRVGTADRTYIGAWADNGPISVYSLTVNLLSVANTDVDLDDIIDRLF